MGHDSTCPEGRVIYDEEGRAWRVSTDPCRTAEFISRVHRDELIACEGLRCGGWHRFFPLQFQCPHTGRVHFAYATETAHRGKFVTVGQVAPPACCDAESYWTGLPRPYDRPERAPVGFLAVVN